MTPDFAVTVAGADITPLINPRLVSLTLTDKRAFEADELRLVLSNTDGRLALPSMGASITVHLGFKETGLVDKGIFVVDEMTDTGPPDQLSIHARSADFHASLNEHKRRSFDGLPLGEVLRTIAADHGLDLVMAEALAWQNPGHIDQASESDGHLLTRLGRQFDAVATVKAGRLLFARAGTGQSASGTPLGPIAITRGDGDRHTFSRKQGSTDYSGVKAQWHDVANGVRKMVIAGGGSTPEKLKTLATTFKDAPTAQAEADSEWARIQRARDTMSVNLAIGRAALMAETPVTLSGWRPEIDAIAWICGTVTHTLSGSGFTTAAQLETVAASKS